MLTYLLFSFFISNFWHGVYTNVFLYSSNGKSVQRLWGSWTSYWFLGCKLFQKIPRLPFFEIVKENCVFTNFSKLLLFQFMEGSMLDGIYWEYLYNDGTDKRFVCLHFLCSICLHISCLFNFLKGLYVLEEKKQWVPVL